MSHGTISRRNVAKHRRTVVDRDGECVVANSMWALLVKCGGGLTVQHRTGKGMGGSGVRDLFAHDLLTMCAVHNGLAESSAEFHETCVRAGWSVPRWAADQVGLDQIPVWYSSTGWFLLRGDGRVHISEQQAQEAITRVYGKVGERGGVVQS